MVTKISTYAELEALQKSPDQYVDWMAEVVAEKLGVTPDSIAQSLQRALAKAALPNRLNMHDGTATGLVGGVPAERVKAYELAKKAGFATSDWLISEYGGRVGEFKSAGDFMNAVYATKNGASHAKLKSGISEASGSLGGFLVPEEYRMEIRMLQLEEAQFRGKATVIPMTTMVQHWPYVRDTSHVSSVYGGVIGYWESESGLFTSSQPTFGMLTLTAHKLTAYTEMSNEVMTDSGGEAEAFFNQQFPKAVNFFEERGFWKGNGGGMPLGVMNAPALHSVTRDTTGTINFTDVVNMDASLLPSSADSAVWFASVSAKPAIWQLAVNVGTGGGPVMINVVGGGGANRLAPSLLGHPIVFTEHMKALGTAGDLVLADLSYYLIGDRQTMALMASPHYQFAQDRTAFRLIERLDGQPWLDSALTLEDGVTIVSPFIALTT